MKLSDALFNRGPFQIAATVHPQAVPVPFKVRMQHWVYASVAFPMIMYAEKPGNLRWRLGWWINERFCL